MLSIDKHRRTRPGLDNLITGIGPSRTWMSSPETLPQTFEINLVRGTTFFPVAWSFICWGEFTASANTSHRQLAPDPRGMCNFFVSFVKSATLVTLSSYVVNTIASLLISRSARRPITRRCRPPSRNERTSLFSVISSRRPSCSTTELAAISFRRREASFQGFFFSLSMVGTESKSRVASDKRNWPTSTLLSRRNFAG